MKHLPLVLSLCFAAGSLTAANELANQPPGEVSGAAGGAAGAAASPGQAVLVDQDAQDVARVTAELPKDIADPLMPVVMNCSLQNGGSAAVSKFVELAVGKDERAGNPKGKSQFHALVHVILYDEKDQPTKKNCWFIAKRTAPQTLEVTNSTAAESGSTARIFGSDNVAVVFALLNRGADLTVESNKVFYRATVKKKLSQNLKNLIGAVRLMAFRATAAATPKAFYGAGFVADVSIPSDITVVPADVQDGKEAPIGKVLKVDNEGKYWWDVSIGIPATKLTSLEYQQEAGRFSAKEVNKQTAYAMLNIFLGKVDVKGNDWRPRLLFGTGITGRPGDRLFAGAGMGLGIAQIFAGTAISNNQLPDPGNPAVLRQKYGTRFAMGVNVPVARALELISKKK